ncbi:Pho23p NDAI_0F02620 [Naumovozyma dairenensis CBS 421]|uniref:Chromatin modification-related protein n=1 Tax=Naumovozyma dairenensis (strain ATCC 10597 / BCRC 20456 / CBS 421 / NBRC 0211 / NRRL Y-12639) TaxID=1071378 RepID=G0WCR9_NAUDC|nr:hypothetical protein NDAI_0F02620 [Naumovozyma dairenensis CBS 421]CCD25580.1 hypothetical protein NDAI_0F02620 [Naumovozyma dairenensis CBS 421]
MNRAANLYPGLNDIADVLEEFPVQTSRYLTLLHEIDAKCVHSMPLLNSNIDSFLREKKKKKNAKSGVMKNETKGNKLRDINELFEELMPSLEEKMHVSSIMLESLKKMTTRMELAYEVALKNGEIPETLRLGVNNHPAMHLHNELMDKIENKTNSKSSQALKSESRREAMAANKKNVTEKGGSAERANNTNTNNSRADTPQNTNPRKRNNTSTNNDTSTANGGETRKRKRRANNITTTPNTTNTTAASSTTTTTTTGGGKVKKSNATTTVSIAALPKYNENGEPLYCYCNQIAYGEMVGCDGPDCKLEWFHLPCIGLKTLPNGKWYCDECKKELGK